MVETLYDRLDDASRVVDAGDNEDYAYQSELKAAARLLGVERDQR